MKTTYLKPELREVLVDYDRFFCLSDVSGAGGSTGDYGEDDENIFSNFTCFSKSQFFG